MTRFDPGPALRRTLVGLSCLVFSISCWGQAWDRESALAKSQAAIGNALPDLEFTRSNGVSLSLAELAGKPLLISMIFTSCHHVCPTTTRRLDEAVRSARDALGPDSFNVLTIGFDSFNDTPSAMRSFANQQSVDDENWYFLSGKREKIDALSEALGFVFFASPRGFDHITQVSVIDREGVVYEQVYGMQFELPWLVEPLKELVFDRRTESHGLVAGLIDRIRIFCTTYDPATDRYHFDFSLFIQMAIGFAAILGVAIFLVRGGSRPPAA